jgi:hypothetical protein
VISAPVIGGPLEVKGKGPDKATSLTCSRSKMWSAPKILKAALFLLLGVQQPAAGLRAMRVASLEVHSERPLVSPWTGSSTEACRAGSKSSRGRFA